MYAIHLHNIILAYICVCLCAILLTIFVSFFIFQPELVSRVEKDLLKIIAGGTADNLDILSSQLFNLVNFIKISLKLMVVEILLVDYPSYLLCPNKFVYLTWGSRDNPQ